MGPLKITIAGAGIGGLAAALALARDGHSVRVIERAHEFSQVGAGIQVSPNGMAVLLALGLEKFPTETVRLEAVRLRDGPNGREVATLDFRRHAGDPALAALAQVHSCCATGGRRKVRRCVNRVGCRLPSTASGAGAGRRRSADRRGRNQVVHARACGQRGKSRSSPVRLPGEP